MNELFLKIVNMSISASWLVPVVLLLRLALKKAPKWVSVMLWGIVAVRLVCPFSIESPLSLIPSTETIPLHIETDATPAIDSGIDAVNAVINPVLSSSFSPAPGASANPLQIWIPLAALLWMIGMAGMFLYTAVSGWLLHRKTATAVRYRDNIFQSENVLSPFVRGIIRPRIYLPFKMEPRDLEYVIAHEQAHIRRKDHWWKPLGFLLLTIHWFNPLVWLSYALLCRDIELACDEAVIRKLDREQKAAYSQALVFCSVNQRMVTVCPLAFGEIGVKDRVKSILKYRKPSVRILAAAILVCLAVGVCFLTNPISVGDHVLLSDSSGPAGGNRLLYDMELGTQAMSGELYVEQWVAGTCVQSAPVILTQDVETIEISMTQRRVSMTQDSETGVTLGTDIRIELDPNGGSLLTYFPHPEPHTVLGWSFSGYELNKKEPLTPEKEVFLAAMAFDTGNGIRAYNCKTLESEPKRLEQADNMIVVRAVFHEKPAETTVHSAAETKKYSLTIGAEGVQSIEIKPPNSSGGCTNADGSPFQKGECVWLEMLDGRDDLRGVSIAALDKDGKLVWSAAIPEGKENRDLSRLAQGDWLLTTGR